MKAKYHKFSGNVPIIFVEDGIRFVKGLGIDYSINENDHLESAIMHEVTFGDIKMLIFSESIIRTLYGNVKQPVIESHLALWAGTQKYPNNEISAYKYAMRLAERYNRNTVYEILRKKLEEKYNIKTEKMKAKTKNTRDDITKNIFVENKYLTESPASDAHERNIANYINSLGYIKAERPSVGTAFSDVRLITGDGNVTWLEVKMNHRDNLSNPRVFYNGTKWDTTYHTPAAKFAVDQLNKSSQVREFITALRKFAGIPKNKKIVLPTTKGGLKDPDAIPLKVMKEYFSQPGVNRYILIEPNVNLGRLVTIHYTKGKAEPAYYMQAGDDFYMISKKNPFNLPSDIPVLTGKGEFKVRVATRANFYEIQAEVKITDMPSSKYSVLKGTKKKNPFEVLKKRLNKR